MITAEQIHSLGARYVVDVLTSAALRHSGGRRRDASTGDPHAEIGDQVVVDLYAEAAAIYKGISLYWRLANVFDEDIRTPSTYPTKAPGVSPDDIPGKGRIVSPGARLDS